MRTILGSRRNQYLARVSIFLIMAALVAGMAGCPGGHNPPPSQNLEIRTWYDLDAVRDNLEGNHTLMNDLNSTTPGYEELAGPTANGGKGWEPIVAYISNVTSITFTGTFDGQGYEIHDLLINRPDEDFVGLFAAIDLGAVIKDIGVTNVSVVGKNDVGGLAGGIYRCTVIDSYSSGSVIGNWTVGGLMGYNANGTVIYSYSTGSVTGYESVGGLAGRNYAATVSTSHFTGNVTGSSFVGGMVGENTIGIVSDSCSGGSVTGYESVGGLVGSMGPIYGGYVSNSYSTGSVTGNNSVGGLVGRNLAGTVSNSFWDTETSGQATSDGGTGKNTTEMKDILTFSGAGWNIIAVANSSTRDPAYIWNIVNNVTYPFLSWESI